MGQKSDRAGPRRSVRADAGDDLPAITPTSQAEAFCEFAEAPLAIRHRHKPVS
jgi:hypothetical protein